MDDKMDEQVGEQLDKLLIPNILQFEWYLSCWKLLSTLEWTNPYCLRCYTAQFHSLPQSV